MKSHKTYRSLSMVTGLIVTSLFLLIAGPKLITSVVKSDPWQILKTFMDWHDDPTAFFLTYFIGYAIIWWKPLWGSIVILMGCFLYFFFNLDTMSTLMFIIPAMLVAVFYILFWVSKTTKRTLNF